MRCILLATFLALAPALRAQDAPGAGFALTPLPYPGANSFSATTTLSDGDILVFDGLTVAQYSSGGGFVRELAALPSFVFPSFLVVDPGEQFALIGESSTGGIHRLSLGTSSAPVRLATLAFNYDAAMHDSSTAYVSAATRGFGRGNEIWRIDIGTQRASLVARIAGASGPLAFDSAGNLYYGTASATFPPPPKPSAVVRWSAAQLESGLILDRSDSQIIGGGFSGAARLAYDPGRDALFLLENNFATGENRVRRVLGPADESPVLIEGRPFLSMGSLTFQPGSGGAAFLPHQPQTGGTLYYTTTDFGSLVERAALQPLRPTAILSGPGTQGAGLFELTLEDGPPGGFARILLCPRARFHATESARPLGGVPIFLGLDLASLVSVPGLLALDAQGHLARSYTNPGGYEGQFALQLLLYDAHFHVVASSSAAFL